MAALSGAVKPVKKHGYEETTQGNTISKLRITLTSKNMKNIEKVSVDLVSSAKGKGIKVKGPVRMPTETLRITTRKSPCGEGTSTWDRLELRTHKRVIDLFSTQGLVKQVTAITMEPGVDVEVMVADL